MFLEVVRFQSPKLESSFQSYQQTNERSLHLYVQVCAIFWNVLYIQQMVCISEMPQVSRVTFVLLAVMLSLAAGSLLSRGWCTAVRREPGGMPSFWSTLAFCTAWFAPLVWHRHLGEGSASLPGRVVALLAVLLEPSLDVEQCLLWSCALAMAAIGLDVHLLEDRSHLLLGVALTLGTTLVLGAWGCQLQQGIERMQRELFLLQYRAAAKSQHFRLLLGCMLPTEIVEPYFEHCIRFEIGDLVASPVAQRVQCAGVLFMAIDAFDEVAVQKTPIDVIRFLNELFSELDRQCELAGLVKVETVGEVYMAAAGLFAHADAEQEEDEASSIAALARFALRSRGTASDLDVELRMGLHCGPLVSGILGDKLPRFRLFGDTVNTAARLEQNCPPSRLLLSEKAAQVVKQDKMLAVSEYGMLPMKGLGKLRTFQVEYRDSRFPEFNTHISQPTLARMLGRDHRDSLGSQVTSCSSLGSVVSEESTASSNLQGFLAGLPELDTGFPTDVAPARDVLGVPTPHTHRSPPMMSPLWDHLERGLKDPPCIEAEHFSGEQQQAQTKAAPSSTLASLTVTKAAIPSPRPSRGPSLPLCSPTGYLSPGQQLPPRRGSLFRLGRPSAGTLPSVLEGDTFAAEDPPAAQLEELRCKAEEAACRCWQLPLLGPLRFQDVNDEMHFRELHVNSSWPSVRIACVSTCLAALALVGVQPSWASLLAAGFTASVLWTCCCALPTGEGCPAWWASAHVVPGFLTSMLASLLPRASPAVCELFLWFSLACTVHAELPYSAVVSSATLARCLVGLCLGWSTSGPAAIAVLVFFLVSFARESLARRCFASEWLCADVLNRLSSVAENLMPPSVVTEMRSRRFGSFGQELDLVVHSFEVVSVLQTDLVGFTAVARTLEPEDVLRMLNELFTEFDRLVGEHKIFKMETVGDAYICATGLPDYDHGKHRPQALLQLTLDLHAEVLRHSTQTGLGLGLRAGLHTGEAIGGVVGTTMQRYHLFGGTMHVVEKLEATSPSGAVHLSEAARCALEASGQIPLSHRGHALELEPMQEGGLVTSKGEHVPQHEVGGQRTFAVRPPCAEELWLSEPANACSSQMRANVRRRTKKLANAC